MATGGEIRQRKLALVQELDQARDLMAGSRVLIREKANVKKQVQKVFKKNPKKMFFGALAAGLGGSILLGRKKRTKEEKKRKTVLGWIFGWIFGLVAKRVKKAAVEQIKVMALQRLQGPKY